MKVTEPETIVDIHTPLSTVADSPATDAGRFYYKDIHNYRGFAIRVENTLDQPVILTVYGNFARGTTGADYFPDRLTLGVGSTTTQYGIISFHMARSAWTPWIYCQIQCPAGAPSSGYVYADIIKFDPMTD